MTERVKLRVVLGLSLGLATAVMLGLPLLYLRLPNPHAVEVASLDAAGRGAYLEAEGRVLRLFPHANPQTAVPADAPEVSAADGIVIVARQLGPLSQYRLRRVAEGDTSVATSVARTRAGNLTRLRLTPPRLAPGVYELAVPKESMYGGTDYVYFAVSP